MNCLGLVITSLLSENTVIQKGKCYERLLNWIHFNINSVEENVVIKGFLLSFL